MKKFYPFFALAALVFVFAFAMPVLAETLNRTNLQTSADDANLTNYNSQAINDALTDIVDSTFNLTSDDARDIPNAGRDFFTICGDATTVNNNTVYYGPSKTLTANTANGQACDINAAGNTTEANEDTNILARNHVVVGMTCRNEADANADITFTLRRSQSDLDPSVTCTIADNARDCVADVQSDTTIFSGNPVAIAVSSTSDIADGNGFLCKVSVAY